jgi:hypothetical protein
MKLTDSIKTESDTPEQYNFALDQAAQLQQAFLRSIRLIQAPSLQSPRRETPVV